MLDSAHLSTREKVSLQEFIDRILHKFKDKIVLIRLYGSKARGDFYKESDIDLLIVLKEKDKAVEDLIVEAEYERWKEFTKDDAEEVLKEAEEFVKTVEKLLTFDSLQGFKD